MKVTITKSDTGMKANREDVKDVHIRSDGSLTLRFSDGKEHVDADEYVNIDVRPSR